MSRENYHHGNLRNELIELATSELEIKGENGISLRDMAARLGVARSAPYRHFPTRSDLLAAVAQNAIEEIRLGFLKARDSGLSPRNSLKDACRFYLHFAQSHPKLYRLIYDPDVAQLLNVGLQEKQAESSIGIFSDIMARAFHTRDTERLHNYTVSSMAILHGYASLRLNPGINTDGFADSAVEMVISIVANIDRMAGLDVESAK
jgi:AcrR family transcriptional regulator